MTLVTARHFHFLMLVAAMLFAPLAMCLGQGTAIAATPAVSVTPHMAHHSDEPLDAMDHSGGGDTGEKHFCPDCQPPGFLKTGKAGLSTISISGILAVAPASQPFSFAPRPAGIAFKRVISTAIPPPPPKANKVRLQI